MGDSMWRDPPPQCDECKTDARWSIQNYEDGDWRDEPEPIVRWFACGRHLHGVLDRADWHMDAVQIMDFGKLR